MKTIKLISLVFIISMCLAFKSDHPAYLLYTGNGKQVSYKKMINDIKDADIIFFGEYHNNPMSHWLEFELVKSIYQKRDSKVILGAEMFESDNQLILDEYMQSLISTKRFENECKLWGNYSTDYEPLVSFARDSSVRFIATNIPRRYAEMVNKKGIETLNKLPLEAKKFIAPLPVSFAPDSVLRAQMGVMAMMHKNLVSIGKAQAIKDATMAYFIHKNLKENHTFIHFNGTFHSDNRGGIVEYLLKYDPTLKIKIISTVQQDDISFLEDIYMQKADYIINVPLSMIRTY